jgi:hypothetical protein
MLGIARASGAEEAAQVGEALVEAAHETMTNSKTRREQGKVIRALETRGHQEN